MPRRVYRDRRGHNHERNNAMKKVTELNLIELEQEIYRLSVKLDTLSRVEGKSDGDEYAETYARLNDAEEENRKRALVLWDFVEDILTTHCGRKCWYGSDGEHIHNSDGRAQFTWDMRYPSRLELLLFSASGRKRDVFLDIDSPENSSPDIDVDGNEFHYC